MVLEISMMLTSGEEDGHISTLLMVNEAEKEGFEGSW